MNRALVLTLATLVTASLGGCASSGATSDRGTTVTTPAEKRYSSPEPRASSAEGVEGVEGVEGATGEKHHEMRRDDAGHCPLALDDVTVRSEEVEGGAAIVFTTTSDVAELRERVAKMAQMHTKHGHKAHGDKARGHDAHGKKAACAHGADGHQGCEKCAAKGEKGKTCEKCAKGERCDKCAHGKGHEKRAEKADKGSCDECAHGRGHEKRAEKREGGTCEGHAHGKGMKGDMKAHHEMMSSVTVRSEEVEGGARLVFTPKNRADLAKVREGVSKHAEKLASGTCPKHG